MNLACTDPNSLYKESFIIPNNEWTKENNLEGSWIPEKSISGSAIILGITYTPEFGYQNLYLTGNVKKGSQILWEDTFSIQLAQPKGGQWLGKKQGDFLIYTDTLPYPLSLEKGEEIHYQFSQFSREDMLKGIKSVEIEVAND